MKIWTRWESMQNANITNYEDVFCIDSKFYKSFRITFSPYLYVTMATFRSISDSRTCMLSYVWYSQRLSSPGSSQHLSWILEHLGWYNVPTKRSSTERSLRCLVYFSILKTRTRMIFNHPTGSSVIYIRSWRCPSLQHGMIFCFSKSYIQLCQRCWLYIWLFNRTCDHLQKIPEIFWFSNNNSAHTLEHYLDIRGYF